MWWSGAVCEADELALDLLEQRVERLERTVLGSSPCLVQVPSIGVTESLLTATTLLLSALSGRDKASSVVHGRLQELEAYLWMECEGTSLSPAAAYELVLASESRLRNSADTVRRLKAASAGVLASDALRAVPSLWPRLAVVRDGIGGGKERASALAAALRDTLIRYGALVHALSRLFLGVDAALATLEPQDGGKGGGRGGEVDAE